VGEELVVGLGEKRDSYVELLKCFGSRKWRSLTSAAILIRIVFFLLFLVEAAGKYD